MKAEEESNFCIDFGNADDDGEDDDVIDDDDDGDEVCRAAVAADILV